ncbi:hypothetical protein ACFL0L_00730 [Patescibacteria group bacterium]
MTKHISLDNKEVTYTLRKSRRARRMRLAVFVDGSVVVTTPYNLRENIDSFVDNLDLLMYTKVVNYPYGYSKAYSQRNT